MATLDPDDINPYRAPAATIGHYTHPTTGGDAELIRRTYLSHESSVRALGALYYLIAVLATCAALFMGAAAMGAVPLNNNNLDPSINPRILIGVVAGIMLIGTVLSGGLGYGLRGLQPWARWVVIVLMALSLLSSAAQVLLMVATTPALAAGGVVGGLIGALIPVYILYLMASSKGAMVFSREYRDVITATPFIKSKLSLVVKLLLGLLIGIIGFAIIVGVLAAVAGRSG